MSTLKTVQTEVLEIAFLDEGSARHEHRVVDCGHNLPWEAPRDFADAILTV